MLRQDIRDEIIKHKHSGKFLKQYNKNIRNKFDLFNYIKNKTLIQQKEPLTTLKKYAKECIEEFTTHVKDRRTPPRYINKSLVHLLF